METIITPKDLQIHLDDLRSSQRSIGLVPTMGYLHDGHLSLIRKAKSENDVVVTTIFVNPLQFSETEDLDTYPKDIEKDTFLARDAGTDFLFTPSYEEMFYYYLAKTSTILYCSGNSFCGRILPGNNFNQSVFSCGQNKRKKSKKNGTICSSKNYV